MNTFTLSEIATYYQSRAPRVRQTTGRNWRGPCPIHGGNGPSFAVDSHTGRWYCHSQCGRGGDLIALEMGLSGASFAAARDAVYSIVGRPLPASHESPTERRARIARDTRLRAEADRIAAWRDACLRALRRRWHHELDVERRACWLVQYGGATGRWRDDMEDLAGMATLRALDIERRMNAIRGASAGDLLACYRDIRGTRPRVEAA